MFGFVGHSPVLCYRKTNMMLLPLLIRKKSTLIDVLLKNIIVYDTCFHDRIHVNPIVPYIVRICQHDI